MGISEIIKKLEDLRQKRVIVSCVTGIVLIFVLLSGIWSSSGRGTGGNAVYIYFGAFAVIAVSTVIGGNLKKEFNSIYKLNFVKKCLEENFENVNYDWEHGFNSSMVKSFGLSKLGNRFHSEDFISARYRGIDFSQSDVTIKYETSGKHRTTTTYFNGRMFVFDCPGKKVISVQVFSNNFMYRGTPEERWKMNKVNFEDMTFNKRFDVTSMDEHEAFYLITPVVLERIQRLRERYGNIALHYTKGKLYVGFNSNENAFDANIYKKIDFLSEKQRIERDAKVIKDIIDTMILSNFEG